MIPVLHRPTTSASRRDNGQDPRRTPGSRALSRRCLSASPRGTSPHAARTSSYQPPRLRHEGTRSTQPGTQAPAIGLARCPWMPSMLPCLLAAAWRAQQQPCPAAAESCSLDVTRRLLARVDVTLLLLPVCLCKARPSVSLACGWLWGLVFRVRDPSTLARPSHGKLLCLSLPLRLLLLHCPPVPSLGLVTRSGGSHFLPRTPSQSGSCAGVRASFFPFPLDELVSSPSSHRCSSTKTPRHGLASQQIHRRH